MTALFAPRRSDGTRRTKLGLRYPKAQRNFRDSDSKTMERGGEFVQGYNCHAAVHADSQVIVAQGASHHPPDTHFLVVDEAVEGALGRDPGAPAR